MQSSAPYSFAATPVSMAQPIAITEAPVVNQSVVGLIERVVDARVEQALRAFRDGEAAQVFWEVSQASSSAIAATQHARQVEHAARSRLESEVRSLAEAQTKLLTIVEGLHGDQERQHQTSSKTRSEAIVGVEKLMTTVDELQRSMEQDGDGTLAKFRQQQVSIAEFAEYRKVQTEESARLRAAFTELRRLVSEASTRQRQHSDELAHACSAIAGTRQEFGDLSQVVQRLEGRLASFCNDVVSEVAEEVQSASAKRDAEAEAERHRIEALQRDVVVANTGRIDLEAKLEALRVEVTTAVAQRTDVYTRTADAETRQREGMQALARRIDTVQANVAQSLEETRRESDEITQTVQRIEPQLTATTQRFDQQYTTWRSDVSREIEGLQASHSQFDVALRDHAACLDGVRRETAGSKHQFGELEGRLERAMRDDTSARVKDLEACLGGLREEFGNSLKKMSAELRSDTRALVKSEQNSIAALDEQLWLTDQRLGQRVDELMKMQAARQTERNTPRSPRLTTRSSRSIERSEQEAPHVRGEALWHAIKEPGRAPLGTPRSGSPCNGSPRDAPASSRGGGAPAGPPVLVAEPVAYERGGGANSFDSSWPSQGPTTAMMRSADTSVPLSDAHQLALLRDARTRRGLGGGLSAGLDASRPEIAAMPRGGDNGGFIVEAA
jgi:hypothetical protein